LQRYRIEYPRDPHLLTVSSFLVNYPFANRVSQFLDVIDFVKQWDRRSFSQMEMSSFSAKVGAVRII